MNLVLQTHTAICMHRTNRVEVLARLAKPTKISCIEKSYFHSDPLKEWMTFNLVQYILVMIPRISLPGRVPKLVKLDGAIV
uniref:Uncharacterized protein At4g15970-like n=1 Tax=Rhizophora mucronata TaxID=61149 RepID=A0A2P2L755_RHIMU